MSTNQNAENEKSATFVFSSNPLDRMISKCATLKGMKLVMEARIVIAQIQLEQLAREPSSVMLAGYERELKTLIWQIIESDEIDDWDYYRGLTPETIKVNVLPIYD